MACIFYPARQIIVVRDRGMFLLCFFRDIFSSFHCFFVKNDIFVKRKDVPMRYSRQGMDVMGRSPSLVTSRGLKLHKI